MSKLGSVEVVLFAILAIGEALCFGDSISFEELPENIHVYLTSNNNSDGVIFSTWIDGDELSFRFPKVKLIEIID